MDKCKKKTVLLCVICTVVCLLLLPTNTSVGQSVPDSFMARQEQARILERDIGVLEGQLAESQGDWIAVSQKLDGLEKKVMASYFEIDQIEEEIERPAVDVEVNLVVRHVRQSALSVTCPRGTAEGEEVLLGMIR